MADSVTCADHLSRDRWLRETEGVLVSQDTHSHRAVDIEEAMDFLKEFFVENPALGESREERMHAVADEIARTGTYRHSEKELVWGARSAWRNAAKCIGRFYWQGLLVRDR